MVLPGLEAPAIHLAVSNQNLARTVFDYSHNSAKKTRRKNQTPALQLVALRKAGCQTVFKDDGLSGAATKRFRHALVVRHVYEFFLLAEARSICIRATSSRTWIPA